MNWLEEAFKKLWYEKKPEEFEDFLEDQEEELEIKKDLENPEKSLVEEVSVWFSEWISKTLNPENSDLKKINSEEFNKKFSESDKIFLPENTENLTDLWKQIYELWNFENLFSSCEIWEVFIENKWKDISFELKSKDWYKIFKINEKKLFWWYSRFRDREDEAKKVFWFEDERQSLPSYVFTKNDNILDEKILRWLTEIDKVKFEENPYISWKYYEIIKNSFLWKEAIKKTFDSINNKEEKLLKEIKENKDWFLEKITKENPLILTLNNKSDLEKMNILLDWNIVALYSTWSFQWYFEILKSVWEFSKIEIPSYRNYFSELDIKKWIENILEKVSFSADSKYKDAYIKALKEKWFEVEKIWNSWFEARNSYEVLIPTKKQETVILKTWKELDWNSFKEEKIWIYWFWEVEVSDLDKKTEIEFIMKEVEKLENNKKSQEFINDFNNLSQDWITAIIKVWWIEKYNFSDIPENFYKIAEIKVWNTADHRQNRTHTYDYILLDKTKIEWKKSISIKIPDNYKWIVIWKWWSNIKNISQELWIRVNIR